jgi:ELWxxDGT repeat protein
MLRSLLLGCFLLTAPATAQLTPIDFGSDVPPTAAGIVGPADDEGERLLVAALIDGEVATYTLAGTSATRLTEGGGGGPSVVANGLAFFLRYDSGTQQYALWRTDGSEAGTIPLATIEEGTPGYLAATSDRAFFLVSNPGTGFESTRLWTSDGTPGGTRVVEDARPAKTDGLRYVFTPAEDVIYFSAEGGSTLWQSDGETSSRVATFGEGRPGEAGAFFYGNALATGGEVYALVGASPAGLYRVEEGSTPYGAELLEEVAFATTNRSLVPFGDGVLFAAPTAGGATSTFYTATPSGVEPVGLTLDTDIEAGPNVTARLADGSAALVGVRDGQTEVWRLWPDGERSLAIRFPEGETIVSGAGAYEVPVGVRTKPPAVLAGGELYAVSQRVIEGDDGFPLRYTLWRADDTGGVVVAADLEDAPRFGRAGGHTYVALPVQRFTYQLYALGDADDDASVEVEPGGADEALTLRVAGANPVRGRTALAVTAPAGESVRVEAFDLLGRRVALLHDGTAPSEALRFDTSALSAGLYVVRAHTATASATTRIVVAS